MDEKCSWPGCIDKADETVQLKYMYKNPTVDLCKRHYDLNVRADKCWESIINTAGYQETRSVFDPAYKLFTDALLTYNMGINASAALLCRASMEAAMHAMISTQNPKYDKSKGFIYTFSHNPKYDRLFLTDLIKNVKKSGYLGKMGDKIDHIKNNGDFIAHYGEKFWHGWEKLSNEGNSTIEPIKLWISDEEATKSLEYTSEIISELVEKFYNQTKPNNS